MYWNKRLGEVGIEASDGSVGDAFDNALAETINGLFKTEVIHRRGPWKNFDAVEYEVAYYYGQEVPAAPEAPQ